MKGNLIYLSVGSNLGDRLRNLKTGREFIRKKLGNLHAESRIYESAAWGYASKNLFFNCCMSAITFLDPVPLLDEILSIEQAMGRERGSEGYTDRVIDMDLLFYGDAILDLPRLKVPHPAMEKRRFVLAPLWEIAPELVHPVNKLTVTEMLDRCKDPGVVRSIETDLSH